MPQAAAFAAQRRLMLSWRLSEGSLGARVKTWIDCLKDTLRVQFRTLQVIDATETGDRRDLVTALREDKCDAFFAVYTLAYCLQCEEEAGNDGKDGENELVALARRLDESRMPRWVARLHVSPPWEAAVGPFEPWKDRQRWIFLPGDGDKEHFRLGAEDDDLSTDIYERCVARLKQTLAPRPTPDRP